MHDFIVGNEPNLNRFWLPQFGPSGEDVAASAYVELLAQTYDAIKARATRTRRSTAARWRRAASTSRAPAATRTRRPRSSLDLGAAYRASGRAVPIMDAFAFHPYPERSTSRPTFAAPELDGDRARRLRQARRRCSATAFDGTAQRGSTLPILYDEFGVETQIPAAKARPLHRHRAGDDASPSTRRRRRRYYVQAMQMSFCQPTVLGLLLFHFAGRAGRARLAVRRLLRRRHAEERARRRPRRRRLERAAASSRSCAGLQLTPKVTLNAAASTKTLHRSTLDCSLDCRYDACRLDAAGRSLTGDGGRLGTPQYARRS